MTKNNVTYPPVHPPVYYHVRATVRFAFGLLVAVILVVAPTTVIQALLGS